MGRNVRLEASPIGNLAVQRNTKTGKYKGVVPSGKGTRPNSTSSERGHLDPSRRGLRAAICASSVARDPSLDACAGVPPDD